MLRRLVLITGSVGLIQGCSSDLFHGTDWPTACELNPQSKGCPGEQPKDAAADTPASTDAGQLPDTAATD